LTPVLPVRLVVFDLDGTLVDSVADIASAANRMLARVAPHGALLPLPPIRSFVGDGARELVARVLARAEVEAPVDEALGLFLEAYRSGLLESTRPYPGVVEGLDALRDRPLAVLTNKPGDMSREILAGLGLADRFFRIYGGGDVPGRKPDPTGLRLILDEVGVPPGEALLVGDSPVDVRTGRNAGTRVAGVTYGLAPEGFAAEPPDVLVGSLADLAVRMGAGEL
jgi:phosphoglycolate phosphatase